MSKIHAVLMAAMAMAVAAPLMGQDALVQPERRLN